MSYGVPFPGGGQGYPSASAYGAPPGAGAPMYANPNAAAYGASPGAQYGAPQGVMPPMAAPPPAADPYANAKPGTIAYAKSEGPDGIATYTPVIAQETFYQTPTGTTRGIKWVTATQSQATAAGIPSGSITAANPAQLPQTAGMMPPISMPIGALAPPGPGGYGHPSPGDDYPAMKPGMSQRDYDKAVRRWEKDKEKERRREEKERRREEKAAASRKDKSKHDRDSGWGDPQDPYDIAGTRERPRRGSVGAALGGFERARRMSGGAALRDDDLSRKLESLDMSFNSRRERRMSGGAAYAPSNVGGFRSRKNSMNEGARERKISSGYDLPRQSFYPPAGATLGGGYGAPVPGGYGAGARSMPGSPVRPHSAFPATHHDEVPRGGPSPRPGYYSRSRHASPSMLPTHLPGGYGGSTYGGARDAPPASAYPYGNDARTPYSTASALPATGDSYALTRRPAGGAPPSVYPVSGREINRAQPFTAFEEFFLVEDLRELLQPQPPPLPAALVPHDVIAEDWDRCMQGLITLASQATQSSRSSALDPLTDLISQWNTAFFLPRGVDIGIYKGNSRRSEPLNIPSSIHVRDDSESESESSSSSSSESSDSEDDRYSSYSSSRRDQRTARRAERKARRKEKARRRRARRRQRSVSIRIRAVPIN